MVSTQKRIETKNSSRLTDWLNRPREKKPTTDQELEKALELSQREHVAEQQRIYQQVRRLSKGKQPVYKRPTAFPAINPHDTDDDDDVFQTVSTRPPLIKTEKKRKRKTTTATATTKKSQPVKKEEEEEEEEQLIIDDVSEWLGAKKEKEDEEEVLEIDNVSSWLQEEAPIKTAKTEKEQDEQDETLEIEDVSAWLDEDNNQTNEDVSQPPKKKQRRVRCHICNKLVERDDIRLHTRQCTIENEDDIMSTHNNNETSAARHSPTSSHHNSNERTATRPSPSTTRNNNERSLTRYPPSSSSNSNEPNVTKHSPSTSNSNARSVTRYPASTYSNDSDNQGCSSSSSSKQECPICFKLFDMTEIEVHSSTCNLEQEDMQVDPFSSNNNDNNNDSPSFDINMDHHSSSDTMTAATHEGAYEFTMERQVYEVDSGDSSSEYSFIDMSSSQFDEASVMPRSTQEEEDDGYLSPLEGHVNILEDPQRYQQFFTQFAQSTSSNSTRGGSRARTTRGRKSSTSTRSYFAKKNFYKKRGRGGRGGFGRGKSV